MFNFVMYTLNYLDTNISIEHFNSINIIFVMSLVELFVLQKPISFIILDTICFIRLPICFNYASYCNDSVKI